MHKLEYYIVIFRLEFILLTQKITLLGFSYLNRAQFWFPKSTWS